MAGLAESCSHVGSLLFAIEAAVKIRNSATVTQTKAYWLLPSGINKVEYAEVNDINVTSTKTRKKQMDKCFVNGEHVSPSSNKPAVHAAPPTSHELDTFVQQLSTSGSRPAILSIIPGYADQFVPKSVLNEYPQVLTELADEACFNMDQAELCEHCQFVARTISVSPQQATAVELVTRKQACDKRWFAFRSGRVTASRFKRV